MKRFQDIKNQISKSENNFSTFACLSKDAIRLNGNLNQDIRLEFERDVDKIIHTNVYTRYIDKTQVYSDVKNDNISKRMTHVQFVSRASRTIARGLGLNEDLCEAIALGHDVGHTPFGHTGERILNDISKEKLGKVFAHNLNSVRVFTTIENNGKGCNLTLQVLDGIMCHNGEIIKNKYAPIKKDIEIFKKEYEECFKNEENIKKLIPMTLEGCVVRISDVIGYIGKDIEDAKRLKNITNDMIPNEIKEVLGTSNSEIMDSLILDIIENSYDKGYITMSEKVYNALNLLMDFNLKEIYLKANSKKNLNTYNDIFNKLFYVYMDALNNNKRTNSIFDIYLKNMDKEYINNNKKEQIIIDYMAGMTNRFIENEYERYVK